MLVRSVGEEGQAVAVALAERAVACRIVGARRLLRPRRGARRARLAAAAGRPARRPRRRARARAPADRAALGRHRALRADRAPAADRHGRGAASRRPSRRSSRPRRASGSSTSSRSQRAAADGAREHARRPLRPPPDRAPRAAPPAAVHGAAPTSSSGCSTWPSSASWPATFERRVPGASAREFARYIAVLADAGLGEKEALARRAARGAVAVMSIEAAAGLEFDHVFVLGLHAARTGGGAPSGRRPRSSRSPTRWRPRRCAEQSAEERSRRLLYVAMTRAAPRARARLRGELRRAAPTARRRRSPRRRGWRSAREWESRDEELFGPAEALHSIFRERRDELLAGVARLGTRLGRAALRHRPRRRPRRRALRSSSSSSRRCCSGATREPVADALDDINARLGGRADAAAARGPVELAARRAAARRRRATRARAPPRWPRARSRRSRRSCRGAATGSCSRPPTSRPTSPARCATSSRACCGSRASRRSTSASGSSCTRCSSASTAPAAAAPRR